MISRCLVLHETTKLFSKMAVPSMPPSTPQGFQVLHSIIKFSIAIFISHSSGTQWYLTVGLISISLMATDIVHVSLQLLAFHVCLIKCFFFFLNCNVFLQLDVRVLYARCVFYQRIRIYFFQNLCLFHFLDDVF
jgi:hypothetical protein